MDISESIEQAIASYFSQWLVQHPYLAWTIAHPLPSVGLVLLAIFSLWGLLRAIARGIEQVWIFLLKTPFKLLQPIFILIWRLVRRIFGHNNLSVSQIATQSVQHPTPERIEAIVDRLQTLNHEQSLLLQELSTSIGSTSVSSASELTSDTQYSNM
jgi:hypothetical protein